MPQALNYYQSHTLGFRIFGACSYKCGSLPLFVFIKLLQSLASMERDSQEPLLRYQPRHNDSHQLKASLKIFPIASYSSKISTLFYLGVIFLSDV